MKTILVIAYLAGGHVIETETLDAANMAECQMTKQNVLSGVNPITTRYGADVKISADCRPLNQSADMLPPTSVF